MKPIGSEKIQNADEKLARILEIAGVKKNSITESKPSYGRLSNVLHEAVAADGTEYGIVQEEKHVYIKVKNGQDYNYVTGVENIHEHSYKSYADALKHLNLMFKQINENVGQYQNIDILKKKL
jgi:transposase